MYTNKFTAMVLAVFTLLTASEIMASAFTLEEVVVSARRVEENLQSTPVAVSALDSYTLEQNSVLDIGVIEGLAPGVTIEKVPGFSGIVSPVIRGIGTVDVDSTIDPAISVIVDGFYYARMNGGYVDLYDLESVEVLRGPQGTLFGRNSLSGAINVKTKRPTGEFSFRGNSSVAEYGRRDFNFAIEGGITDNLAAKLVVMRRESGTHFDITYVEDGDGGTSSADTLQPVADLLFGTLLDQFVNNATTPTQYCGPGEDYYSGTCPGSAMTSTPLVAGLSDSDVGEDRWNYRGYLRWQDDESGLTLDLIGEVVRDSSSPASIGASAPGVLSASNGSLANGVFPLPFMNDLAGDYPLLGQLLNIDPNGDPFSLLLPFTYFVGDCVRNPLSLLNPGNGQDLSQPCLSIAASDINNAAALAGINLNLTNDVQLGFDYPGAYAGNLSSDSYNIRHNGANKMTIDVEGLVLDGLYESEVGDFAFNVGHRKMYNTIILGDIDGSPYDLFRLTPREEDHEQTNFEFRYSNQLTDSFSLTAGMFYIEQDYKMTQTFAGTFVYLFSGLLFSNVYGDDPLLSVYGMTDGVEQEQSSLAFFLSTDYYLTESWRISIAGRYTQEEKDFKFAGWMHCPLVSSPGVGDCDPNQIQVQSRDWENFSPRFSLDYQVNDDTFVYGILSKAFRSGGFNSRAFSYSDTGPYDPESVTAYELGLKTELLDGKVRFNTALFRSDYEDLQRESLFGPGATRIENAAEGTIQGWEFELTGIVTESFRVNANFTYLDTSYDDFFGDINGDLTPENLSDTEFVRAPRIQYTVGGDYLIPMGDLGEMALGMSYAYVDDNYHTIQNFESNRREAGGLLSAFVRWDKETDWGSYYLKAFGTNLTDEVYLEYAQNLVTLGATNAGLTQPRTFGLEIGFKYE